MKKRIHINQHKIRSNNKTMIAGGVGCKGLEPVVTCKTYKDSLYGHSVFILGESKVIYSPNKPLSCGAKVWIETSAPVDIIDHLNNTTERVN